MKNKPVMVQDYNVHMLGVDKLDQLMSYYCFLRKSVKWWRKVFFWVLEVAVINAYIVYKELALKRGERPMSHLAFRRCLIEHLSEPMRSSAVPRSRSGRVAQNIERLRPERHFLEKVDRRTDCSVCSGRVQGETRHLTLYRCKTCSDKPPLCPAPCFEQYHTLKNYHN